MRIWCLVQEDLVDLGALALERTLVFLLQRNTLVPLSERGLLVSLHKRGLESPFIGGRGCPCLRETLGASVPDRTWVPAVIKLDLGV